MSQLERWERATEWPLAIAAVAFLVAYGLPIVVQGTPAPVRSVCSWVMIVTWLCFGIDYVVRLFLADRRWEFVRRNLLDLAVIALPLLRPLRLLRLVALLAVLNRVGSHGLRGRVVTYVVGGTALLVLTAALAATDAERGAHGAQIADFGDGLWWAFATITTVGYGDHYPVTTTGRAIAVALMLGGIALLGVVTATLASWLVERVSAEAEVEESATRRQVEILTAEVRELRAAICGDRGNADAATPDR